MLDNWESFSSTLITDPFLDEPGKFKDDFESTATDFCDSIDSLSNEPPSSKSSVTSSERIYSLEDSDSLDDRATSSSEINSLYDIHSLEDNVFAPDLSLFEDSRPSPTHNIAWCPKAGESLKPSTAESAKRNNEKASFLPSLQSGSKIIRINRTSNQRLKPFIIPTDSTILKMTVVSAATPVCEVIKTAGIGLQPTQLKNAKVIEQPKKQVPTRIVLIKKPVTTVTTYIPLHTPHTSILQNKSKKCNREDALDNFEMPPILTREAPFQPEQLSPIKASEEEVCVLSQQSSSSSRPYQLLECSKCQKKLASKHALAKHLHIHEPARYKCNHCKKMFYERSKLRRHQSVHSPEKRYECDVCESRFTLEQNLRVHMRIHQNPESCLECKNGFSSVAHLKSHITVHSHKPLKKLPSILKSH